ncbi:MAG TPA: DPP IV N-terminal domain-containing protein [Gemmatimonadaceae bacterium]|nr:DPP IV N-terminal domain-containing protein [Gemmatimonadaceae bacterium]
MPSVPMEMRRPARRGFLRGAALLLALAAPASVARAQGTREDYARAERFLGPNAQELVIDDAVQPHWFGPNRFWYRNRSADGYEFLVVDATTGIRRPAFDQTRLAAAVSVAADTAYDPHTLPFREIRFVNGDSAVRFSVGAKRAWTCSVVRYTCTGPDTLPVENVTEVPSPDGRWVAFTRQDNLWVREAATGREIQLTNDAEPDDGYAKPTGCCAQVTVQVRHIPQRPVLVWSPDSKYIATYKMDERHVRRMYLLETKSPAFVLHSYPYALPGDSVVPTYDTYVFDVAARHGVKVDRPPQQAVNTTCCWLTTQDSVVKDVKWDPTSEHLFMTYGYRGYHQLDLLDVDPATGHARTVLTEKSKTFVETNLASGGVPDWRPLGHGRQVIWFSERDGWAHLYLYDARTGALEHRITEGDWTVGDVLRVDETGGWVYFTARGREAGRDPYFRFLYRIHLDGTGMQLLTPENADHDVSLAPSGAEFLDSYSRLDATPVTVVRRMDGTLVHEVQRADASRLFALGWKYPTPIVVKARDGVTDLYGVLYRPANFDSTKRYPIVDYIYPGPQTGPIGDRTFDSGLRNSNAAMAQLGFFIVEIDAMGTPFRSKAFHDTYYGSMHDNGIPDLVTGIKQLAVRYPQIDLDRVGIYGHSGGGFSSTDAMLTYPDFFKVAVSRAGNHDNRSYDYTWGEKYQGLLVKTSDSTDNYDSQANQNFAANLKGKLLIMYGTMDDNVSPVNSLLLINALIKANKDFDLLVLPNRNHGFGNEPYVLRRTWDYFVQNLLGVTPPEGIALHVPSGP